MKLVIMQSAAELPAVWDELADNYFQKKVFLKHCEHHNYCQQRYYILYHQEKMIAGAIIYKLTVNLFTYFQKIKSPLSIKIIGIPCSISTPGIFGHKNHCLALLKNIEHEEKGLILCLNINAELNANGWISGRTLPDTIFINHYNSWQDYINSLNSNYRRRYKTISNKFNGINIAQDFSGSFTEQMYFQYLAVYNKSKAKLEKLNYSFFKQLSGDFCFTKYNANNELLGWNVTFTNKFSSYFLFGGINYQFNESYSFYHNMLFHILKCAIDGGIKQVNFGQTAEIPKLRLGSKLIEKRMLAFHHNTFIRGLLMAGKNILEYRPYFPIVRVFKQI